VPKKPEVSLQQNNEEHLCFSLIPENSGFIFRLAYLVFGLYIVYYPLMHDLVGKFFYKR